MSRSHAGASWVGAPETAHAHARRRSCSSHLQRRSRCRAANLAQSQPSEQRQARLPRRRQEHVHPSSALGLAVVKCILCHCQLSLSVTRVCSFPHRDGRVNVGVPSSADGRAGLYSRVSPDVAASGDGVPLRRKAGSRKRRGEGGGDRIHDQISANTALAAAIVASTSSSVCASDMKPASYWLGAR